MWWRRSIQQKPAERKRRLKQTGRIEIAPEEQGAPPEDAPVGGQVVVAITPGTLSPDMRDGWSRNSTNDGFIGLMSGYAIADYNRERVLDSYPVCKRHENRER